MQSNQVDQFKYSFRLDTNKSDVTLEMISTIITKIHIVCVTLLPHITYWLCLEKLSLNYVKLKLTQSSHRENIWWFCQCKVFFFSVNYL